MSATGIPTIDPTTALINAGVQGAMAAANVGMGIHDRRQSKKMLEGLVDPLATIPLADQEALGRSKYLASLTDMPGQENLEADQDQIVSSALGNINSTASSSGDALQALLRVWGGRQKSQNQIGFQSANNFMDRQNMLNNELQDYGNEEKRLFDINVVNPFNRKLNYAYQLGQNGNQLISGGTGQMLGTLGGYTQNDQIRKSMEANNGGGSFDYDKIQKMIDDMLGGGGNNGIPEMTNPATSIPMDNYGFDARLEE